MKSLVELGVKPVDSLINDRNDKRWSVMDKLFLGLTPGSISWPGVTQSF